MASLLLRHSPTRNRKRAPLKLNNNALSFFPQFFPQHYSDRFPSTSSSFTWKKRQIRINTCFTDNTQGGRLKYEVRTKSWVSREKSMAGSVRDAANALPHPSDLRHPPLIRSTPREEEDKKMNLSIYHTCGFHF